MNSAAFSASDPRNGVMMKMLAMVEYGERAGSGLQGIFKTWESVFHCKPQLEVSTSGGVDRTTLSLNFEGRQPDIEAMKRLYGNFGEISTQETEGKEESTQESTQEKEGTGKSIQESTQGIESVPKNVAQRHADVPQNGDDVPQNVAQRAADVPQNGDDVPQMSLKELRMSLKTEAMKLRLESLKK